MRELIDERPTMKPEAIIRGIDRIIFLLEEIAYLKTQIKSEGTGHIHTTIGVLQDRVKELKKEFD